LYEIFHCTVVPEYIVVVCDLYRSANRCGWTSERHEEEEVSKEFYNMDLREIGLGWGGGLDSTGSGQGPVASCYECGDEPPVPRS
jgi:hypothetical protein